MAAGRWKVEYGLMEPGPGDWPVSHCGVKTEWVDGWLRTWNRFAYAPLNADLADDDWSPWELVQDEAA